MIIIGDAMQSYPKYRDVAIELASHYNLPYAMVMFADRNASTYDGVHPNAKGMQEMADQIWASEQSSKTRDNAFAVGSAAASGLWQFSLSSFF